MDELSQKLAEKMARMYLAPQDMFTKQTGLYSRFDQDGIPTHDVHGKELSKSTLKKLKKDWEKQDVLYNGSVPTK